MRHRSVYWLHILLKNKCAEILITQCDAGRVDIEWTPGCDGGPLTVTTTRGGRDPRVTCTSPGLLEAIIQIASLKCPDTTHLPLPMTSSAPELVPLITILPPSRVHYRLSTSHSTHILTQFVTSRLNRVYNDNHFFFIV